MPPASALKHVSLKGSLEQPPSHRIPGERQYHHVQPYLREEPWLNGNYLYDRASDYLQVGVAIRRCPERQKDDLGRGVLRVDEGRRCLVPRTLREDRFYRTHNEKTCKETICVTPPFFSAKIRASFTL